MPYIQNPRLDPNVDTWLRADMVNSAAGMIFSSQGAPGATVDATVYMSYLGKSPKYYAAGTTFTMKVPVTQGASGTITWAEVGIWRGDLVLAEHSSTPTAPTLTRLSWLDTSTWTTSAVMQTANFILEDDITPGTGIWFGYGSVTTGNNLEIDSIGNDFNLLGLRWNATSTRISSALAGPFEPPNYASTGNLYARAIPPWCF